MRRLCFHRTGWVVCWDGSCDKSFGFAGGVPRFDNAGTFRKSAGGTTVFNNVSFNNYNDLRPEDIIETYEMREKPVLSGA